MAALKIDTDDLAMFAPGISEDKANEMIAGALAMASRVAPCINNDDFPHAAAAKLIIIGAIQRWNEAAGAVVTQQAGIYSQTVDNRSDRRMMFWPSEINDLAALCADAELPAAYVVPLFPET